MDDHYYEIAIIGGGPAGSTAAIFLKKYGFDVCLIEKKIFPRETICGEFLSKEVLDILNELDLFNNFISLDPNPISSIKFISDHGVELKSELGFTGYGLKRGKFDDLLLKHARLCGVDLFQPVSVKKIIKTNKSFHLILSSNETPASEVTCRVVIAAYGKQNLLDKVLKRKFTETKSGLNGIKFHIPLHLCPNLPQKEIQIYSANGIYCGVNAVDNKTVTVCFLEDRKSYTGSSRGHLKHLFRENKSFRNLFDPSISEFIDYSPVYGSGNIYFGKKSLTKDGIIMIGDAARVIAPLAGDGISMAMQSAKIVSDILRDYSPSSDHLIKNKYESKWNEMFRNRVVIAKLLQKIILNDKINILVLPMAKIVPSALGYIVNSTRG